MTKNHAGRRGVSNVGWHAGVATSRGDKGDPEDDAMPTPRQHGDEYPIDNPAAKRLPKVVAGIPPYC